MEFSHTITTLWLIKLTAECSRLCDVEKASKDHCGWAVCRPLHLLGLCLPWGFFGGGLSQVPSTLAVLCQTWPFSLFHSSLLISIYPWKSMISIYLDILISIYPWRNPMELGEETTKVWVTTDFNTISSWQLSDFCAHIFLSKFSHYFWNHTQYDSRWDIRTTLKNA